LLNAVRDARKPFERIVLLFGCGGDRDPAKRPVMGRIASALADFVILTSDNSRSEDPKEIIAQILVGVRGDTPCVVIEDRADAIVYAIQNARAGDVILLAGKGHETYEITRKGRRYFNEREIVQRAFADRRRKKDSL
jgi:UDP-N-acetylmuramoyl-L-alanyl-D-glutamate--2,6-diaminopimelate ligase